MKALVLLGVISGCAPLVPLAAPPPAPPPPPALSCPPATLVPPALPHVVSTAQLAQIAADQQRTLAAERARGDQCAHALHQLDDWARRAKGPVAGPDTGGQPRP